MLRQARVPRRCCSSPGCPFIVRAVQIYVAANYPQAAQLLRVDAADVPRVPRAAGLLRLPRHDLRRRRADRQRSPRQRAADLSVEAADAHRVHRRQAGDAGHVPAARHAGAGDAAAPPAGAVRGQLRVPARQPVPVPGDHRRRRCLQALVATFTMLALSSLSKSSRYVGDPLRRHHLLHRGDLRRAAARSPATRACRGCRSARTSTQVGDVIFRQTPRYAHAVAGVADRRARPDRRCRSRCSSGASAAWRW